MWAGQHCVCVQGLGVYSRRGRFWCRAGCGRGDQHAAMLSEFVGRFWGAGTGSVLLWKTRVWLLLPNSRPNPLVVCAYHVLTCCSTTACCNTNSQQPTACATFGAAAAWRVLSSAGVCCAGTVMNVAVQCPTSPAHTAGANDGGEGGRGGGSAAFVPPRCCCPCLDHNHLGSAGLGRAGLAAGECLEGVWVCRCVRMLTRGMLTPGACHLTAPAALPCISLGSAQHPPGWWSAPSCCWRLCWAVGCWLGLPVRVGAAPVNNRACGSTGLLQQATCRPGELGNLWGLCTACQR